MSGNLAYQEESWEEVLDGQPVLMSPRPAINHNIVSGNIYRAFASYLSGKPCMPFVDGVDVYLTEKDRVIPDGMIVCDREIIKRNGIHGAPDLIVEVLSPGTKKNDKGYKKALYEKCGVREYWIVDIDSRSVEVYVLTNGIFVLDEVYQLPPECTELDAEERAQYKTEIKVSLYEDLFVPLEMIFSNLF